MNAIVLALCVTAVINSIVGFVVLLRNTKAATHWIFFFFCQSVVGWVITNAIFRNISLHAAYYDGLASYFFAALVATFLSLFLQSIGKWLSAKQITVQISCGVIIALLSAIPGVLSTGLASDYSIITTPLVNVYGLFLLVMFAKGIVTAIHSRRKANAVTRAKLNTILMGFVGAIILGVIFNLVLPVLFHSYDYVQLGPLAGFILVVTSAYAIIRHKLFDIRLIIARAIAYVLVLGTVAAIYAAIIFGISALFSSQAAVDWRHQIIYIIPAAFLAFTFQPLRRFFDKQTNQIFYQDAYDPQLFLNHLNKVLVSVLNTEALLKQSSQVIANTLKAGFCVFGIKETVTEPQRFIGTINNPVHRKDLDHMRQFTQQSHAKVIITDEISDEHSRIRDLFYKYNIAVVARLTTQPREAKEGYGHLMLGYKKSGNPYSRQDVRVIEIITDELTIAIQNALRFEEIENFNITLQQKVNNATRKLRQTNEKLQVLDQTKDEFISMASHQLRTPLTSVKGYVSMVLEGDAGKLNDMQRKLLDQAFVSSQRMVFLIADLLNVSRLKTGKFVIEGRPTNLAEVVQDEVSQLRETAESRNLKLTYRKPQNLPLLMLDETKIRQVIMNFIDNAIYYTPANGTIDVVLKDTGEAVELRVSDSGIGVPAGDQHRLFTKFYRAENAKKARPDGTGLGLFMAKKVIAVQGGAILFNSREDKGSTFGFTFPKSKLVTKARPIAPKMSLPIK